MESISRRTEDKADGSIVIGFRRRLKRPFAGSCKAVLLELVVGRLLGRRALSHCIACVVSDIINSHLQYLQRQERQ